MDNRPSFSIIIPLYNKERSIERTMKSVLGQTYEGFELIIVDDGSSDNSPAIVKDICASDERVKYIVQKNAGPSAARNNGIKAARNEWLVLLDADDVFADNALELFARQIINHPSFDLHIGAHQFSGKDVFKYYDKDRAVKNGYFAFLVGRAYLLAGSFALRKRVAESVLYDERMWRLEDLDFMMRVFRITKGFRYFPEPVVYIQSEFASASMVKQPIEKDYRGYLSLKGKSFWERVATYHLYNSAKDKYPEEAKAYDPMFKHRYLLRLTVIATQYYRLLSQKN